MICTAVQCSHWQRPRNHPFPAFGQYTRVAIGQLGSASKDDISLSTPLVTPFSRGRELALKINIGKVSIQ
jgi:hypothetical protein